MHGPQIASKCCEAGLPSRSVYFLVSQPILSYGPVLKSDYFKECKVVLLCSTSISTIKSTTINSTVYYLKIEYYSCFISCVVTTHLWIWYQNDGTFLKAAIFDACSVITGWMLHMICGLYWLYIVLQW